MNDGMRERQREFQGSSIHMESSRSQVQLPLTKAGGFLQNDIATHIWVTPCRFRVLPKHPAHDDDHPVQIRNYDDCEPNLG